MKQQIPHYIQWVLNILHANGYEAFLVGGCVRDLLMEREIHDYDITTNALPQQTMDIFKANGCKAIPTGIKHGTVTIIVEQEQVEITTYRIEKEYLDHRSPSQVLFTKHLLEDLKRRDLTMNAIAYDPDAGFYDPFDGRKDIERNIIRCVGDPYLRLEEDALRILRALRFSFTLNFTIEESLGTAIKQCAPTLSYISPERIRSEFDKILMSNHPNILETLRQYEVLEQILPDYTRIYGHVQKTPWHIYDIFQHTDVALNHTVGYPLESKLAIIFHDLGKPQMETFDEQGVAHYKKHAAVSEEMARTYVKALRYDHKTMDRVCLLVFYHDYYVKPQRKILRKFLSKFDNDTAFAIQALMVQKADDLAKNMDKAKEKIEIIDESIALLTLMEEEKDHLSKKDMKVNGTDMIALGLRNAAIGEMLNYLYEQILEDPSQNTKEHLLQVAKEKMQS